MLATPLTSARRWRRACPLILASVLALLAPHGMQAQGLGDVAFWDLATDNYGYVRNNIPDVDQMRGFSISPPLVGLPPRITVDEDDNLIVRPGGMYCVPTSGFNMLAYIANHGYPQVRPHPRDWEKSPADDIDTYNLATLWIDFMGNLMGTDAQTGTNASKPTLQAMLDFDAPGHFHVGRWFSSGFSGPTLDDMAYWAIGGSLVMPGIGWYETVEGVPAIFHLPGGISAELTVPGVDLFIRRGGHVVCLSYANRNHFAGGRQIGVRDPAFDEGSADPDRFVKQSPFNTEIYPVHNQTAWFGYEDQDGNLRVWQRTQTRIPDRGSARLDNYTRIQPNYGLVVLDVNKIGLLSPVQLLGWEKPLLQQVPGPGEVSQLVIDPARAEHPFLVRGSRSVWTFNSTTLQIRQAVPRLPQEPSDLVLGTPSRNLYLLLPGNRLLCLPPTEEAAELAELPRPVNARLPIDAMTWDESRNMLVVVSAENQRLRCFDADLEPAGEFVLPPGVLPRDHRRRNDGDRRISLTANPRTGEIFTHRDGDRHATRLTVIRNGRGEQLRADQVPIAPEVGDPVDLHVDELGTFFATDRRTGLLSAFNGNGEEQRDNPFHGLPGGRGLQISRSFSNFDPEVHTLPSFDDVLPEEEERRAR